MNFLATFYGLLEFEECNADALYHIIQKSLLNHRFKFQRLFASNTDNGSVMIEVNNGVYVELIAEKPSLLTIRCTCHSLQLTGSHAFKEYLPIYSEHLFKYCYNWFSHSSVKQMKYKKLCAVMNDRMKPLKLIQSITTHWMSTEAAIVRILMQLILRVPEV